MSATWTDGQRARLCELIDSGAWLGYWCSDAHGGPANGGRQHPDERVRAGLIQRCDGHRICERGYHATTEPHRWRGSRVWVVALLGPRDDEGDKACASVREIVGEIMPEDAIDPMVAARLGVFANLTGAYLSGANLTRANLTRADLTGANLYGANLYGANLTRANLTRANLYGANLYGANLTGAYLTGAYLTGAYGRADWADIVARGAIR